MKQFSRSKLKSRLSNKEQSERIKSTTMPKAQSQIRIQGRLQNNSTLRDHNDAQFLKLSAITHSQLKKPITDGKTASHLQMLMHQNRQSSNDYFQTNRVQNTFSLLGNHKFTPNSSGTHYYESQGSNLVKNEKPTTNDSRTEDGVSLTQMLITGRAQPEQAKKVDQGTTVENSLSDSENSSDLRISNKMKELDHSNSNQIRIEEFPELDNRRGIPHTQSNQTLDTIEAGHNDKDLRQNQKSVLKLNKIQKKNILLNKNKQVQFSNLNDVLIKESLAKVKKQILMRAKLASIKKKMDADQMNEDLMEDTAKKTQSQSVIDSMQIQSRLAKTSMGFTQTTFSSKFKPQKITPATHLFTNLVNYQVDSNINSIDMKTELESIRREHREKEKRALLREESKNNEAAHALKNAKNMENLANLHERGVVRTTMNRTLRTSCNSTTDQQSCINKLQKPFKAAESKNSSMIMKGSTNLIEMKDEAQHEYKAYKPQITLLNMAKVEEVNQSSRKYSVSESRRMLPNIGQGMNLDLEQIQQDLVPAHKKDAKSFPKVEMKNNLSLSKWNHSNQSLNNSIIPSQNEEYAMGETEEKIQTQEEMKESNVTSRTETMINDQLETTQRARTKDFNLDSKFFDQNKTQYSNSKMNSQNINHSQFSSTMGLAHQSSSKAPIQWINLKLNKKVIPEVPACLPVRQRRFAASLNVKTQQRQRTKSRPQMNQTSSMSNYKSPYQQKKDPYYVDYVTSFFKPGSREQSGFEFEKSERWRQLNEIRQRNKQQSLQHTLQKQDFEDIYSNLYIKSKFLESGSMASTFFKGEQPDDRNMFRQSMLSSLPIQSREEELFPSVDVNYGKHIASMIKKQKETSLELIEMKTQIQTQLHGLYKYFTAEKLDKLAHIENHLRKKRIISQIEHYNSCDYMKQAIIGQNEQGEIESQLEGLNSMQNIQKNLGNNTEELHSKTAETEQEIGSQKMGNSQTTILQTGEYNTADEVTKSFGVTGNEQSMPISPSKEDPGTNLKISEVKRKNKIFLVNTFRNNQNQSMPQNRFPLEGKQVTHQQSDANSSIVLGGEASINSKPNVIMDPKLLSKMNSFNLNQNSTALPKGSDTPPEEPQMKEEESFEALEQSLTALDLPTLGNSQQFQIMEMARTPTPDDMKQISFPLDIPYNLSKIPLEDHKQLAKLEKLKQFILSSNDLTHYNGVTREEIRLQQENQKFKFAEVLKVLKQVSVMIKQMFPSKVFPIVSKRDEESGPAALKAQLLSGGSNLRFYTSMKQHQQKLFPCTEPSSLIALGQNKNQLELISFQKLQEQSSLKTGHIIPTTIENTISNFQQHSSILSSVNETQPVPKSGRSTPQNVKSKKQKNSKKDHGERNERIHGTHDSNKSIVLQKRSQNSRILTQAFNTSQVTQYINAASFSKENPDNSSSHHLETEQYPKSKQNSSRFSPNVNDKMNTLPWQREQSKENLSFKIENSDGSFISRPDYTIVINQEQYIESQVSMQQENSNELSVNNQIKIHTQNVFDEYFDDQEASSGLRGKSIKLDENPSKIKSVNKLHLVRQATQLSKKNTQHTAGGHHVKLAPLIPQPIMQTPSSSSKKQTMSFTSKLGNDRTPKSIASKSPKESTLHQVSQNTQKMTRKVLQLRHKKNTTPINQVNQDLLSMVSSRVNLESKKEIIKNFHHLEHQINQPFRNILEEETLGKHHEMTDSGRPATSGWPVAHIESRSNVLLKDQ